MPLSGQRRKALAPSFAVAASAVMWGVWWIPIRALDAHGLSGYWASVAVFAGATLIMLPVIAMRRSWVQVLGPAVLIVGLLFGACLAAWNHALIVGDVVRVTLLFYLAPIWGTILGILMFGMRLSMVRLMTIAMGLCGALVVLGFEHGFPLPRTLGEFLGLGSGALFALGAAAALKAGHMRDLERTFATFALATLVALVFAVSTATPEPKWDTVAQTLPLLLASTAFWYVPITWLMIWGAAQLDPGRVSILLLLEVGVAAVSVGLLTDEPFGWREAVGGMLIIGAGALESYNEVRRHSSVDDAPTIAVP